MGDLDIEQGKRAKWLTRISVYYVLAIYEGQKNISVCV